MGGVQQEKQVSDIERRARENGATPAWPCREALSAATGLTKREAFAMAAMQGLLASAGSWVAHTEQDRIECAVRHADALLRELAVAAQ